MDFDSGSSESDSVVERLNYKLYNFRRPDKFSKDHLRALQSIHENFCRHLGLLLTGYLRCSVELEVVSVDQLTYEEFVRSMPSPMTIGILEMQPLPGQVLLGFGYEVTSGIIDRMLGGSGRSDLKPRELTDIEQSLIRRVIDRTLTSLDEAWQSMMDINFMMVGMEESYALIQVVTPGEIVALVTFEITVGKQDSGLISFCIPYPVVEEVIEQLSAQRIFHGKKGEATAEGQDKVLRKLNFAKIPVEVHLGGTEITVREMMELNVGDVVRLDRRSEENLLMCVNQRPKFYCRPGTRHNNLAVYVTEAIQNRETVTGFGLPKLPPSEM